MFTSCSQQEVQLNVKLLVLVYNQSMRWTGRSFIQEMKLHSEKQSLVSKLSCHP